MPRYIDADLLKTDYYALPKSLSSLTVNTVNTQYVSLYQILNTPTADVRENVHAKWLWVDGVRCSNCNHKLQTTGLPSFCPNCGAQMEE